MIDSLEDIEFNCGYLIGARKRSASTEIKYPDMTAPSVIRYKANGALAGNTSVREIEPLLPEYWKTRVSKVLDGAMYLGRDLNLAGDQYQVDLILIVLEPKYISDLLRAQDFQLFEDNMVALWNSVFETEFRDNGFRNRTCALDLPFWTLFAEPTVDLQRDTGNGAPIDMVLRGMGLSRSNFLAEGYSDLVVCKAHGYGQPFQQLALIRYAPNDELRRISEGYNQESILVADSIFDVLALMYSFHVLNDVSATLQRHSLTGTDGSDYMERLADHSEALLKYEKDILPDFESWVTLALFAADMLHVFSKSHRTRAAILGTSRKMITRLSSGATPPYDVYNHGMMSSLCSSIAAEKEDIEHAISSAKIRRELIREHLSDIVGLNMHQEATQLARMALWVSVLAFVVSALSIGVGLAG